ncbi:SMI1/KNR4 family protein [Pseudomonas batumici]|uniref:SMI1/KNR4 family protein n=1 Tax=Pseudomonas batumici TaxID=226910 RepID=UPI0030D591F1
MKSDLIEKIENVFRSQDCLRGKPATDAEIQQAENLLKVTFNEQYVEFIKLFGGAFGGIDIHAFNNGSLLGKATVIDLTLKFRNANENCVPAPLKNAYVISDDGAGNPILMNSNGQILIYLHDEHEVEILYESLEVLLTKSFS